MHQRAFTLAPTRVQRLLQRIEHEVGLHGAADSPADDAPRVDINDEGHVYEALPGRDVGEVRHPQLVGSISLELAVHTVQRACRLGIRHGGTHLFAAACAL